MKITKARIKQLIQEEIKNILELEGEEGEVPEAPQSTQRGSRATKATETGGVMDVEEYLDLLKKTLGTEKATSAVKARALDVLFPGKGRALVSLLLKAG